MSETQIIDYWLKSAAEDVVTAESLFELYKRAIFDYTLTYLNKAKELYIWLETHI